MTVQTFALSTVVPQGVDGAVVYSSAPSIEAFGTDATPVGWPTAGKLTAVEVELTATSAFTADRQVQAVLADPLGLSPITGATIDTSGTWSNWTGSVATYRSSSVDAYALDKFGTWATDYLTVASTSTATNNTTDTPAPTGSNTFSTAIDLSAQIRIPSARASGRGTIVAAKDIAEIYVTATGIGLVIVGNGAPGVQRLEVTWATAGISFNTWHEVRGTWSASGGLTLYVDGASVGTAATGGGATAFFSTSMSSFAVGNGGGASGIFGNGLGGDYRTASYAATIGGTPPVALNLDQMDSSTDTSWPSSSTTNWTRRSSVAVTGATVPATKRIRWDAEIPFPIQDCRLIIDAQTGALTVDEIVLYVTAGRRGHGMIR